MWKKGEEEERSSFSPGTSSPAPRSEPARQTAASSGERGAIGRSITIRGDVTGDEDLVIQGRIEGTVDLKQHNVTIGPEGRVKAGIAGRIVTVEGQVEGDIRGQEQVLLRQSARVEGDIVAPRVVLEDGASFRGSIDMSTEPGSRRHKPADSSKAAAAPTTTSAASASGMTSDQAKDGARGKDDRGSQTAGQSKPVAGGHDASRKEGAAN